MHFLKTLLLPQKILNSTNSCDLSKSKKWLLKMKEQQLITKLKAHKKLIDSTFSTLARGSSIPKNEFNSYVAPFEKYRKELIGINSDLYEDFVPKSYETSYGPYNGDYTSWELKTLSDNIQYLIDISPQDLTISPTNFTITNQGIFFAGQYFDAFMKISEIFTNAKSEIILIDGYINEKFLGIFSSVPNSVKIKILTKNKSLNAAIESAVEKFNLQYLSNKKEITLKSNEDFHDRFVIIDRKDFFHFGSSLKDAGSKGFMFSKIEEPLLSTALLNEFSAKW